MHRIVAFGLLALASVGAAPGPQPPPVPASPIFRFHTDEFWLNLHHFLYVLGRAEAKMDDASREAVSGAPADAARALKTLSPREQQAWRRAVAFYAAGISRKDVIFDKPLPAIARALADAGDSPGLQAASTDEALCAMLESVAPIYRKAWWPAHRAANVAWRDETQALVDRDGHAVLGFITKAFGMAWPAAGYDVHVAAYSNWGGAYSTEGHLLVVSSLSRANHGLPGLEIAFHEGMHQWDEAMGQVIYGEAQREKKRIPVFCRML